MSDEQHQVTFYLRKFYDQFLDKVCSHHPGVSYTRYVCVMRLLKTAIHCQAVRAIVVGLRVRLSLIV